MRAHAIIKKVSGYVNYQFFCVFLSRESFLEECVKDKTMYSRNASSTKKRKKTAMFFQYSISIIISSLTHELFIRVFLTLKSIAAIDIIMLLVFLTLYFQCCSFCLNDMQSLKILSSV